MGCFFIFASPYSELVELSSERIGLKISLDFFREPQSTSSSFA